MFICFVSAPFSASTQIFQAPLQFFTLIKSMFTSAQITAITDQYQTKKSRPFKKQSNPVFSEQSVIPPPYISWSTFA